MHKLAESKNVSLKKNICHLVDLLTGFFELSCLVPNCFKLCILRFSKKFVFYFLVCLKTKDIKNHGV